MDGLRNNLAHETWGSIAIPLRRMTTVDYGDDVMSLAGAHRESPRFISSLCMDQGEGVSIPNHRGASDYLWQWGQFLDHDIDETPISLVPEGELACTSDLWACILVPINDPVFNPQGLDGVMMEFVRSAPADGEVGEVRQQRNNITAFIDASNVYGSELDRVEALREMDGTGRLKTSPGDLPPFNEPGLANAMPHEATASDYFLAGDIRANEQIALTAMHTLFMREHNYWADATRAEFPQMSGDDVYERARAIVSAEMQAITFREFLPLLLGPDAIPPYQGYQSNVDASIANVFATAAYRVGHTMLSSQLRRIDANGDEIEAGHISLAGSFFNPQAVIDHGIDPILRGLASQRAQKVDVYLINEVRNFLFGPPPQGFDLASLNIQRGRDHGLPSYNQVRIDFGLPPAADFGDVTGDSVVAANLAAAYATVDDIDAWVGMLAEPHADGALVGETVATILADQFARLRDGDRFWYERYLPPSMVPLIEAQTLATIIRRNTSIGDELQDNVFIVASSCPADLNGDEVVWFEDLVRLLSDWGPCTPCASDLDGDEIVDFKDLVELLSAWGACS